MKKFPSLIIGILILIAGLVVEINLSSAIFDVLYNDHISFLIVLVIMLNIIFASFHSKNIGQILKIFLVVTIITISLCYIMFWIIQNINSAYMSASKKFEADLILSLKYTVYIQAAAILSKILIRKE
jgi:hypothetical protein